MWTDEVTTGQRISLDIQDTRAKLGIYSRTGLLGAGSDGAIPLLGKGE